MKRDPQTSQSPVLASMRLACVNEAAAVEFFETYRWGTEPTCAKCDSSNVYKMVDAKTGERNKDYRWRCRDCEKMYTVRTNTIFEETRLPMRAWAFAYWSACSSKKGVSAMQISRECEISYKSALFLMHRIRHGVAMDFTVPPRLSGVVEIDETYVGGKPRNKGPWNKRGFGTSKAPVVALVERDGIARAFPVDHVNAKTLKAAIIEHVNPMSLIVTDESSSYKGIGAKFFGGHETVNHSHREYVRGNIHTNTVEGFFSLLKRGVYGTYHSISRKHLGKYTDEFAFRYNTRKMDDGQRTAQAIRASVGKRLTYKQQIAG